MYTTLLTKIGTTLGSVSRVKDSFYYPKTKLTKYPSVFYFPNGFDNSFETSQENFKTYRFDMVVIIGVEKTTVATATDVLARTVDDIIAQFDQDWDQGTVDGHRVWVSINSPGSWQLSDEQDGLELYAPLQLEIRLLTNN